MLVAVDPPARGFAKISDFFPSDLSKWNLGENFGFIKFKIFEWKLVFPLIFADDFFKIFHSWIFWNCVGGFSDKFGGQVRGNSEGFHLRSQTFFFFWEKENSTPDFARVGKITSLGRNFFLMKFVDFRGKRGEIILHLKSCFCAELG